MFEKLNEELMEVKEKMWERQKLENRRSQLRVEIEKQSKMLSDFQYEMEKEKSDVEELEKMSVATLVYTILGSKNKKLKKETEEFIRARIKYEEYNNLLEELKAEEDKLSIGIMNIGNIEQKYIEIKNQKEKLLMETEDPLKHKLVAITEELIAAKDEQREYKEAVSAGRTVLFEMGKLIESLNSASNWGAIDILGGGMLPTAVKHSHIDSAKECAYRINKYMGQFKRELKDINIDNSMEVNLTSFESFGDYFFDGFFMDYIVQNKIEASLNSAEALKRKLQILISNMDSTLRKIDAKVNELNNKRINFIEECI